MCRGVGCQVSPRIADFSNFKSSFRVDFDTSAIYVSLSKFVPEIPGTGFYGYQVTPKSPYLEPTHPIFFLQNSSTPQKNPLFWPSRSAIHQLHTQAPYQNVCLRCRRNKLKNASQIHQLALSHSAKWEAKCD